MALYRVSIKVELEIVVEAADTDHAWDVAWRNRREAISEGDYYVIVGSEVSQPDHLPAGWDSQCLPYGGDGNTRIAEILAQRGEAPTTNSVETSSSVSAARGGVQMTKYKRTTLSVAIHEKGDSAVYGESAINVSIDDEAAGPFLVIQSRCERDIGGQVSIDPDMWDHVDAAARELLGQFGEGGE